MVVMKRVGIAELKASLSSYLAEVRTGERFVVCDRATPVAWLVPYAEEEQTLIIAAKAPPQAAKRIKRIKRPAPHNPNTPLKRRRRPDVVALMRESRDQR